MTTVDTSLHELLAAVREEKEPGAPPTVVNLRMTDRLKSGSVFVWSAAALLLLLAAAQGYVSYQAQFGFIDAAKHARLPSMLEALGLDTGAVIFALLGLAHARMGRSAKIERTLNIACAGGSFTMNLLGADLGSPRSIAVYVLPPLLYVACSDRLIAVVGSQAGVPQPSVWQGLSRAFPYAVRLILAPPSTVLGLRRWLLNATPLPAKVPPPAPKAVALTPPPARPVRPGRQDRRTGGGSKKATLLRLYADHPDYGDRTKVSAVASELAATAGLQPGTARTYLYAALDGDR
jgi:hypothetical protein